VWRRRARRRAAGTTIGRAGRGRLVPDRLGCPYSLIAGKLPSRKPRRYRRGAGSLNPTPWESSICSVVTLPNTLEEHHIVELVERVLEPVRVDRRQGLRRPLLGNSTNTFSECVRRSKAPLNGGEPPTTGPASWLAIPRSGVQKHRFRAPLPLPPPVSPRRIFACRGVFVDHMRPSVFSRGIGLGHMGQPLGGPCGQRKRCNFGRRRRGRLAL
jgi:hypothetical protein